MGGSRSVVGADEGWRARDGHLAGAPSATLTDGTVLLRLPEGRDGAAFYAYGQDPDVAETTWLPLPYPCSWEAATRMVGEFQQGWQGRFGLTLVITLPPAPALIGVVHISVRADGARELAYGVAPAYRRRGLATRAVRLTAAWAFEHLRLTRLAIVVTAPGTQGQASRRVAEKAGFVYAGMQRSHVPATGRDYEDPLYVLLPPR